MKLPVRMLIQYSGKVTIVDAVGKIVKLVQGNDNNYEAARLLVEELNAPREHNNA